MSGRKIIHIDMDAFFAAIEARDFSEYRHRPIIVGGQPHARGVVSTCNYEARQYGIHSAMPSTTAYRLCPQAIFIKPRISVYREASAIIRQVFARYTPLFEPLSLDEAYLDVSDTDLYQGSATLIAQKIKKEITEKTQLIASAGVSYNKFLAKKDDWIAQGVCLHYLPTYSPELNLIEILWRKIKYEWLSLNCYVGYQTLKKAVLDILENFGNKHKITFV